MLARRQVGQQCSWTSQEVPPTPRRQAKLFLTLAPLPTPPHPSSPRSHAVLPSGPSRPRAAATVGVWRTSHMLVAMKREMAEPSPQPLLSMSSSRSTSTPATKSCAACLVGRRVGGLGRGRPEWAGGRVLVQGRTQWSGREIWRCAGGNMPPPLEQRAARAAPTAEPCDRGHRVHTDIRTELDGTAAPCLYTTGQLPAPTCATIRVPLTTPTSPYIPVNTYTMACGAVAVQAVAARADERLAEP